MKVSALENLERLALRLLVRPGTCRAPKTPEGPRPMPLLVKTDATTDAHKPFKEINAINEFYAFYAINAINEFYAIDALHFSRVVVVVGKFFEN